MRCVCDGGICVATSCRDVTCPVYVMVLYVLLHLVEICPVYVMVVYVLLHLVEMLDAMCM